MYTRALKSAYADLLTVEVKAVYADRRLHILTSRADLCMSEQERILLRLARHTIMTVDEDIGEPTVKLAAAICTKRGETDPRNSEG